MGIKQLYNDNLRKSPNEYGDVSVMITGNNMALIRLEYWSLTCYGNPTLHNQRSERSSNAGSAITMHLKCTLDYF